MTKKQAESEIEYRLAVVLLDECLQKKLISNEDYNDFRCELIKEISPYIGGMELEDMLWAIE